MQFNTYLKACRTDHGLTQEELVHTLYSFDFESFSGLDTTTLSKWERGVTQPRLPKQVSIIKYFQEITEEAFPCFQSYSEEEIEKNICEAGMRNIIIESKSKKLVLDFPSSMMSIDDLIVYQLREFAMIDKVTRLNTYLDKNFNKDLTGLEPEDFKRWALLSGSTFLVCEYGEEIMGLLFVLKLKPDVFAHIMDGIIMEKDLKEEDFALHGEEGSSYILSFFSLNEKAASMLFVRFYAYLIADQKTISEVGVATMMEDGEKLIESINIPYYQSNMIGEGTEVQLYRTSLSSFLSTPKAIKMILSKQDCAID